MDSFTQRNPSNSSSPSQSPSTLVLYSFWQSSCSWRVRFALNLKGLSYEYKAINLAKGEQFSPDSYAILLYLEEKYPQKALLPENSQLRVLNLQVASIISSSIQPLHMLGVLKILEEKIGSEDPLSFAKYNIERGFSSLEKLLKDFSGTYATGEKVSMADVFLAPQISVAVQKFNIDMAKFPHLSRVYKSYMALPEFQASLPERQPDAVL